jgi:hypothetical protein
VAQLLLPACVELELGGNQLLTGGSNAFAGYYRRWPALTRLGVSQCTAISPEPFITHVIEAATAVHAHHHTNGTSSSSSNNKGSKESKESHSSNNDAGTSTTGNGHLLRHIDVGYCSHLTWSHITQLRESLPYITIETVLKPPTPAAASAGRRK